MQLFFDLKKPLCLASWITILSLFVSLNPPKLWAEHDYERMAAEQMVQVYEQINAELLRRLETQIENQNAEVFKTVNALVDINSRKAEKLFLKHIEFYPNVPHEKTEDFYHVRLTSVGNNPFIMYVALYKLGSTTLDQCMAELEKASPESMRENLLAHLAYKFHRDLFVAELRERSLLPNAEKWKRILSFITQE